MKKDLPDIRTRLDEIDKDLIKALGARQKIIDEVASIKATSSSQIRDFQREEEMLTGLRKQAEEAGLDHYFVTTLYQKILDYSVRYQRDHVVDRQNPERSTDRLVVAYQGSEGAYSHLAALHHFSSRAAELAYHGHSSFEEALEAVEAGEADYAVLPIENTTAGSINETYDLLARTKLNLVGEEVLKVENCLVAIESIPVRLIRRISSHPQSIAQCSAFISSLRDCHVESYFDSAHAVKKISEERDLSHAAIASEEAARRHGLCIIKKHIANQKENYTRYVIIAREAVIYDERIPCKTSLIFATPHEKGALMKCLNVLDAYGLNMTKLESRPRWNTPWEYLFYVDIEGNNANPQVEAAINGLSDVANFLKVLGSYPARTTDSPSIPLPKRPLSTSKVQQKRQPVSERPAKPTIKVKKEHTLASKKHETDQTVIQIGKVVIGGEDPILIAGPCSVESRDQILACAKAVHDEGGHILRGGTFKPRTSPYAFQGLGYEGLDLLREAGQAYDLPVITEILHPSDVEPVAREADILQVGARNMQNFALLKEVGKIDRPVMLKRGMMASIDEWLAAAEYILAQGNRQVILCERGIRTFETATRNTLDISAVPVLRERTHLPIVVDPSHAVGTWQWVEPLALAALAAGAHGVMIEIHPDPDSALSDGAQSLKFDTFSRFATQFHHAVQR